MDLFGYILDLGSGLIDLFLESSRRVLDQLQKQRILSGIVEVKGPHTDVGRGSDVSDFGVVIPLLCQHGLCCSQEFLASSFSPPLITIQVGNSRHRLNINSKMNRSSLYTIVN